MDTNSVQANIHSKFIIREESSIFLRVIFNSKAAYGIYHAFL
jgi:hypothetical protein